MAIFRLLPYRSPVTGRQVKTEKKRGVGVQGRVRRHISELGAGHGVLAEGIRLGQDVVPERSQSQASSVPLSAKQPENCFMHGGHRQNKDVGLHSDHHVSQRRL